jgi:hypothetical protein
MPTRCDQDMVAWAQEHSTALHVAFSTPQAFCDERENKRVQGNSFGLGTRCQLGIHGFWRAGYKLSGGHLSATALLRRGSPHSVTGASDGRLLS